MKDFASTGTAQRVLAAVVAISMIAALYASLVYAPTERTQGDVQRIFYFHLALAWNAYLAFFVVFVASIVYLVKRSMWWDALARSSVEVGLLFTTLVLIVGSLWARPIWGTWWTWDARLTTTLLLWFIYVGYLMLRGSIPEPARAARYSAVIGIIGFLDIPIIHQSVTWWRSLHPEAIVLAPGGPAIVDPSGRILQSVFIGLFAFTLLYVYLVWVRLDAELVRQEILALRLRTLEEVA